MLFQQWLDSLKVLGLDIDRTAAIAKQLEASRRANDQHKVETLLARVRCDVAYLKKLYHSVDEQYYIHRKRVDNTKWLAVKTTAQNNISLMEQYLDTFRELR